MTEPSNLIQMDLDSIKSCQLQKLLHETTDENEKVESHFGYEFKKCGWSSTIKTNLIMKIEGDNSNKPTDDYNSTYVTYTADNKFHYLINTIMRETLIPLKVMDKYVLSGGNLCEIAYSHNSGLNFVEDATLLLDKQQAQSFDDITHNIFHQYYRRNGFDGLYDKIIGNVDFLEEWTTALPEYRLKIIQPWFYCKNDVMAIPLFRCPKGEVTHRYKVRRDLRSFIRMRIRTTLTSPWKEIPFNRDYVEGAPSDNCLPYPELRGTYGKITPGESKWKEETEPESVYFIDDIHKIDSDDYYKYGGIYTPDLNIDSPTKAIFFLAENIESRNNRYYSNFTTNTRDIKKGHNPIKTFKVMYGGNIRIPETETDISEDLEPLTNFPNYPREPGYNAISISYDTASLDADISLKLATLKAKLIIKLGNTDPMLSLKKFAKKAPKDNTIIDFTEGKADSEPLFVEFIEENQNKEDSGNSPLFAIHIRCLIIKQLVISGGKYQIITENNLAKPIA